VRTVSLGPSLRRGRWRRRDGDVVATTTDDEHATTTDDTSSVRPSSSSRTSVVVVAYGGVAVAGTVGYDDYSPLTSVLPRTYRTVP